MAANREPIGVRLAHSVDRVLFGQMPTEPLSRNDAHVRLRLAVAISAIVFATLLAVSLFVLGRLIPPATSAAKILVPVGAGGSLLAGTLTLLVALYILLRLGGKLDRYLGILVTPEERRDAFSHNKFVVAALLLAIVPCFMTVIAYWGWSPVAVSRESVIAYKGEQAELDKECDALSATVLNAAKSKSRTSIDAVLTNESERAAANAAHSALVSFMEHHAPQLSKQQYAKKMLQKATIEISLGDLPSYKNTISQCERFGIEYDRAVGTIKMLAATAFDLDDDTFIPPGVPVIQSLVHSSTRLIKKGQYAKAVVRLQKVIQLFADEPDFSTDLDTVSWLVDAYAELADTTSYGPAKDIDVAIKSGRAGVLLADRLLRAPSLREAKQFSLQEGKMQCLRALFRASADKGEWLQAHEHAAGAKTVGRSLAFDYKTSGYDQALIEASQEDVEACRHLDQATAAQAEKEHSQLLADLAKPERRLIKSSQSDASSGTPSLSGS